VELVLGRREEKKGRLDCCCESGSGGYEYGYSSDWEGCLEFGMEKVEAELVADGERKCIIYCDMASMSYVGTQWHFNRTDLGCMATSAQNRSIAYAL
jgi:hypothetical protein